MSALLLSRSDLAALMTPADYLVAAENAFRALAEGRAASPAPLHVETANGVFHGKGGAYRDARGYVVLKFNANFPGNPERNGLPTIQGALLLCDADDGRLLAILDSTEITLRRTAAASALAARHLAPTPARRLMICGCGVQGRAHAEALGDIIAFEDVLCWDAIPARAEALADWVRANLECNAKAVAQVAPADVLALCTSSRTPYLTRAQVRPGAFIAAVGADNPTKSEIAPDLMASAALICDSIEQCAIMGDLHHALEAGVIDSSHMRASLAELAAGTAQGRTSKDEIVIFDSTGVAVQDAAAAAAAYGRALQRGGAQAWALHD